MTDKFHPLPFSRLLEITLSEIQNKQFMGIPESLFFTPHPGDPFRMERYGRILETPVGVAAGPHTQLAVNIVASWLCGARYIELKTVQTLDELEVSKPCIDIQDEGYNCEWSQELRINQSFDEYLNAWIMIHILHKELGFQGDVGTLFNMSVGYDYAGILSRNVQGFFDRMKDCRVEIEEKLDGIRKQFPSMSEIDVPATISDSITLSTMHGCPPGEIEKIGLYLIREKGLHTTIKLNPTLLGADELRNLLNHELGFRTEVPDLAFEHDLKYPDALNLIKTLKSASDEASLHFGIKLTNTLESINNRGIFPEKEKMMYMSGRALHPISVGVARKLQNDFKGNLDISFSGGADCFNISMLLSCGLKPVTVCSDLLKPGGYGRLWQYINNLRESFKENRSASIDEFIIKKSSAEGTTAEAILSNLNQYADQVAGNPAFRKTSFTNPDIKTGRSLDFFDCIHAPCVDTCPTNQDIPKYMQETASGDFLSAFLTISETNPFPSVTGMVCDHLCQLKCTRINYDEALQIREIKRFIAEQKTGIFQPGKCPPNGRRMAIIGGGPAGLSCAWFLNLTGVEVHLFEQKDKLGGMVSAAIPSFRLTDEAISNDLRNIEKSGIKVYRSSNIDKERFDSILKEFDAVFLAAGAQRSATLKIEGINSSGVVDPLSFLFSVRENKPVILGRHVLIVGGGNTAMDAARTAFRMVGKDGKVTIVYRRTISEMPADKGEIHAVLEEGIDILELVNPELIKSVDGQVRALLCSRNKLSGKGKDGRSIPEKIPGSEFEILCDTIIPAIGQELEIDFCDPGQLKTTTGSYRTKIEKVYIGGDAFRGASTAINAIADGRKAAIEMLSDLGHSLISGSESEMKNIDQEELLFKKAIREPGYKPEEIAVSDRRNFRLVVSPLSEEIARKESARCLQCDEICNVCVSVCPNLANYGYRVNPAEFKLQKAILKEDGSVALEDDDTFSITQKFQVLNIRDHCNECGNCTTFCPSSGKPYHDKPGLCLSEEALNEESKGYILRRFKDRKVLVYKNIDEFEMLSYKKGRYLYESKDVKATIHPADFRIMHIDFLTDQPKTVHFTSAAKMFFIMQGALQLA